MKEQGSDAQFGAGRVTLYSAAITRKRIFQYNPADDSNTKLSSLEKEEKKAPFIDHTFGEEINDKQE